jgi:hypothetical protein
MGNDTSKPFSVVRIGLNKLFTDLDSYLHLSATNPDYRYSSCEFQLRELSLRIRGLLLCADVDVGQAVSSVSLKHNSFSGIVSLNVRNMDNNAKSVQIRSNGRVLATRHVKNNETEICFNFNVTKDVIVYGQGNQQIPHFCAQTKFSTTFVPLSAFQIYDIEAFVDGSTADFDARYVYLAKDEHEHLNLCAQGRFAIDSNAFEYASGAIIESYYPPRQKPPNNLI